MKQKFKRKADTVLKFNGKLKNPARAHNKEQYAAALLPGKDWHLGHRGFYLSQEEKQQQLVPVK